MPHRARHPRSRGTQRNSARRPASAMRNRATSILRTPATTRSAVAVARPERSNSTSCSLVKPALGSLAHLGRRPHAEIRWCRRYFLALEQTNIENTGNTTLRFGSLQFRRAPRKRCGTSTTSRGRIYCRVSPVFIEVKLTRCEWCSRSLHEAHDREGKHAPMRWRRGCRCPASCIVEEASEYP
jgi:hypothetical protein